MKSWIIRGVSGKNSTTICFDRYSDEIMANRRAFCAAYLGKMQPLFTVTDLVMKLWMKRGVFWKNSTTICCDRSSCEIMDKKRGYSATYSNTISCDRYIDEIMVNRRVFCVAYLGRIRPLFAAACPV